MEKKVNSLGASLKNNRKIKIFLFCLVLTSFIWLLIELSKTYISSAEFRLEYTNLPSDKLLQNTPRSTVDIVLKAPGFSLLKYKIRRHKVQLNLRNISVENTSHFILPNKQKESITAQLSSETEVIKVLADTIFMELGRNISRNIPVIPVVETSFKPGYNLIDKLTVQPDTITITGPEKIVDTIDEILTKSLELKEISENITVELELEKVPRDKRVVLSAESVKIVGEVDKFTEGQFKMPVLIINLPEGIKVNPYPKEVEIVYQAGLTNFNKINEASISVIYDFHQYRRDTSIQFLSPTVKLKSPYISTFKIVPDKIEFLIQK